MDYRVSDTNLTSIADAIRNKAEISDLLSFPDGFISTINSLVIAEPEPVLPQAYESVDYLESSGTQYIDTGVTVSGSLQYDVDISFSKLATAWSGIMGGGVANANSAFALLAKQDMYSFQHGTSAFNDMSYSFVIDTLYNFILRHGFKGAGAYVPFTVINTNNHVHLFKASWMASSCDGLRIHRVNIYDGLTEVRHMIPARRVNDDVLGMYDFITESFYTNNGTDEFITNI